MPFAHRGRPCDQGQCHRDSGGKESDGAAIIQGGMGASVQLPMERGTGGKETEGQD